MKKIYTGFMLIRRLLLLSLLLMLGVGSVWAGTLLPPPTGHVNDYCNVLSAESLVRLENLLTEYERATSTQIVVVVVPDFQGYDANSFGVQVGTEWGVGQKGKDNGVVILLRPGSMPALEPPASVGKAYDAYRASYFDGSHATVGASILSGQGLTRVTGTVDTVLNDMMAEFIKEFRASDVMASRPAGDYGEAYIVTGYGMEGYLTDLQSSAICRNLMAPLAVMHRYDAAIEVACIAVMEAVRGVYVADAAAEPEMKTGGLLSVLLLAFGYLIALPCFVFALLVSLIQYPIERKQGLVKGSALGHIARMTKKRTFKYIRRILTIFAVAMATGSHSGGSSRGSSGGFSGGFSGGGGSFGGGGGGSSF